MNSNIFEKTMVEMDWTAIEELAKQNALVLMPVGVIEEHGRHLPVGTDIYMATAQAKYMAMEMEAQGFPYIIAPPYYWGICSVLTKHFPGSFTLRPEILKAVIKENLECLESAGFKHIVIINAHGDPLHRRVITEAIGTYNSTHELKAKWLTFSCDLEQEGFKGDEEYLLILPDHILQHLGSMEGELGDFFDVHSGAFETASMKVCYEALTNTDQAKKEKATMLQGEQIHKWLQGQKEDRDLIPSGYVGSPADYYKIQSTPEQYSRAIAKEIIKYYQRDK